MDGTKRKRGRPRLSEEEKNRRAQKRKLNKNDDAWDAKFATLPDSAAPSVELNWIRSHPAMLRLARFREMDKDTRVILEVEDITPSHGEAPSKAAVTMLQHWSNKPDEFHKNLLAEQRKATKIDPDGSIVDNVEESQEIKDIDALIASIAQAIDDMELVDG